MAKRHETVEAFNQFVAEMEQRPAYSRPLAFGLGIAHMDSHGNILDTYFQVPNYQANYGTAAVFSLLTGYVSGTDNFEVTGKFLDDALDLMACYVDDGKVHKNIELIRELKGMIWSSTNRMTRCLVVSFIGSAEEDLACKGVPDIYLRLHLLSRRLVLPNTIGATPAAIMPLLPNVAWTSIGPVAPSEIDYHLLNERVNGKALRVYSVDKLPHMLDYVVPPGVRIADSARVRLGAYVGEGTTVMPSGFINFNAGTLGKAMVEGRVSQGVVVGNDSDLGGAASTQGTMSGGSKVVVSIGERTLIGALAGVGIPLGDDCIVAAGVYVMPSKDVMVCGPKGGFVRKGKAHEFAGQHGLLFKHGSSGIIEVHQNKKAVELNPLLHSKQ